MKKNLTISIIIAFIAMFSTLQLHSINFKLPLVSISPNPLDFDTTICSTTKCQTITLTNISDTTLTIYKVDSSLSNPFSIIMPINIPLNLNSWESQTISYCYSPNNIPKPDTGIVYIRADARVATSIGILFGVNSSMSLKFGSSDSTRISICRTAGLDFVNDMLDTSILNYWTITDEAAVFTYQNAGSFEKTADFSSDKVMIKSGIPTNGTNGGSCIYDAIIKVINNGLVNRSNKRILLVFADSPNLDTNSITNVINFAKLAGTTIYIIGMGEANMNALSQIAKGTHGNSYFITNTSEMAEAIFNIETSLSKNSFIPFVLKGRATSPRIQIDPKSLDFGIVHIGQERCLQLTISNFGNTDLSIKSITNPQLPFSYETVPSFPLVPIPAGTDTTIINFCFNPTVLGDQYDTIKIKHNACSQSDIIVSLKGTGDNTSLGPILRIENTNLDSTFCLNPLCKYVTFINMGDSVINIYNIDSLMSQPFIYGSSINLPIKILPSQAIHLSLCYSPLTAPTIDRQTVFVRADSRVSYSIGLLFDASGSMEQKMSSTDPTQRLPAAEAAGISFVSGLLNTDDIQDEDAVYSFADNFKLVQPFTNDKNLLTQKIQSMTLGNLRATYDALIAAINDIKNAPNKKAIIILTDGAKTTGGNSIQSVIDSANVAGVSIFTIGIGEADSISLTQIADSTGGKFFFANNSTDLIAVYRQIAAFLTKNNVIPYNISARATAPSLTTSPSQLVFDSTRVGQNNCQALTIKNVGDAAGSIKSLINSTRHFKISGFSADQIAPGDSMIINVCFNPAWLRVINDTLYNLDASCGQPNFKVPLSGIGYDSVTVMTLDSMRGGYPGFDYNYPIRLLGKVPTSYKVDSFSITYNYNKTVIYPKDDLFNQNNFIQNNITKTYNNSNGFYSGNFFTGRLNSPASDTTLMYLPFMALLGNSLETPINISSVIFADGNPKVGIISKGQFIEDSSCNLKERLIDASSIWSAVLLDITPNPINNVTIIKYRINEPGRTSLEIYDVMGNIISVLLNGECRKGDYEATFDAALLPDGIYYCKLSNNKSIDVKRLILNK